MCLLYYFELLTEVYGCRFPFLKINSSTIGAIITIVKNKITIASGEELNIEVIASWFDASPLRAVIPKIPKRIVEAKEPAIVNP